MMGPLKEKRVLEIGFGMGAHLIWLARQGAAVVGIDISEERVRAAMALMEREGLSGKISLVCGDIRELTFESGAFDIIYGHDILMYMGGDYLPLAKMARDILRPDGKLVIVEALDGHPAARIYRRLFAPREFKSFTRYFDMGSIAIFRDNFRSTRYKGFYLMAPLAFIWKNWFTFKGIFHGLERGLCAVDDLVIRMFPSLEKYCWRVVFMAEK